MLFLALAGAPARAETVPVVLVLGDSLSAGYGLDASAAWVALLQTRLDEEGYPHRVVNASISGDTSAGGLSRLPAALDRHRPDIVLIELGANDGLRGLPITALQENLERMVDMSQSRGARVAVFEMRIPSNYGPAYSEAFRSTFAAVAKARDAQLVPFFLDEIAADQTWFQDDGIHPNAAAQPKLLEAVWPSLVRLLTLQ